MSTEGGEEFVPEHERIAVFDNDGTLWSEMPIPVQLDFLLRQLAQQARADERLAKKQPWKAALEQDLVWLRDTFAAHYHGDDSRLKLLLSGILESAKGLSVDDLARRAREFSREPTLPGLGRPYKSRVYQPMVQLLAYLKAHGFASFIVSGGGRDFMREFSEQLYGVPRDRVIGSSVGLAYRDDQDEPRIMLTDTLEVFDDGPQKPIRIWDRTGRRPILAAGNSNGDIEMLRFSQGSAPSLCLLLHHDDSEREHAYDTGAEEALTTAERRGWTVISMARDWVTVFGGPGRTGEQRPAASP